MPLSETSTTEAFRASWIVLSCARWSFLMSPLSIAVLAFSMSADACAAAMARGVSTKPNLASAIKGGLVFGVIETITPLSGWALGVAASSYIAAVDHWVAFVLLGVVGGKMALEACKRMGSNDRAAEESPTSNMSSLTLVLTAFATSIDAAAVGVTLSLVDVNILSVALAIGLTTFVLATAGLLIGRTFGAKFGPVVELIGGLGLVAIGGGILIEHLGLWAELGI